MPIGVELDEPSPRTWFYYDAAAISCMAGNFAQTQSLAGQGSQYFANLTVEQTRMVAEANFAFGLIQLLDLDFVFNTRGDYVLASGEIVDRNKNGQLDDDGATFDIGGGVYSAARATAGSRLAPNTFLDLNGNGIPDGCREGLPQSISLKTRSPIPVTRNGKVTISPSCVSEVPCGGVIDIAARLDSSGSALKTIARRRYLTCPQGPCGTQEQRRSDLKLTATGCKLLNRNRGKLQATLSITAGTDKPALTRVINLAAKRGCISTLKKPQLDKKPQPVKKRQAGKTSSDDM